MAQFYLHLHSPNQGHKSTGAGLMNSLEPIHV